jgi:GNAT superfamily N-acetyltransferase
MVGVISIEPLRAADRAGWERLARGYKAFYRTPVPDDGYDRAWRLLHDDTSGRYGVGARLDGQLVGIAHYLFHITFWGADSCYLQDLFVDEAARGHGAARALIEHVAEVARARGAERYYWTTKHDNDTARALYDKLARHNGFIRYDYPLTGP